MHMRRIMGSAVVALLLSMASLNAVRPEVADAALRIEHAGFFAAGRAVTQQLHIAPPVGICLLLSEATDD